MSIPAQITKVDYDPTYPNGITLLITAEGHFTQAVQKISSMAQMIYGPSFRWRIHSVFYSRPGDDDFASNGITTITYYLPDASN